VWKDSRISGCLVGAVGSNPTPILCPVEVSVRFLRSGVTQLAGAIQEIRNLQQTCNEFVWRTQVRGPKLWQQKGLDGGPGESRTPDQRFRKPFPSNLANSLDGRQKPLQPF
jgi:hypothetical protein